MYEISLERTAERDLKRLPVIVFQRVIQHIKALTPNPRLPGCRKITGSEDSWRIRVGDYRIIYQIDDKARVVRIMRVRHRREAY